MELFDNPVLVAVVVVPVIGILWQLQLWIADRLLGTNWHMKRDEWL